MSEHTLPPSSDDWPRDPYLLLGVSVGVSARDLRRAYLHLVRSYKPEHAPEQFQLIREAYEAIQKQSATTFAPWFDVETSASREATHSSNTSTSSQSLPNDPWRLAIEGQLDQAYATLVEQFESHISRDSVHLQLYWLLVSDSKLDATHKPTDWLIRGLIATEGRCPTARELLRRAIEVNPSLALGDHPRRLFEPGIRPALIADFAEWRWHAARRLKLWNVIRSDVAFLRPRSNGDCEEFWPRLLIFAAKQLAWADDVLPASVKDYGLEIETWSHGHRDFSEELLQLDYLTELTTGWRQMGADSNFETIVNRLLPTSFEDRLNLHSFLQPLLDEARKNPVELMQYFDRLMAQVPIVLGHVVQLLDRLSAETWREDPRTVDQVRPPIRVFIGGSTWMNYATCRPELLSFCLTEAIPPELMARFVSDSGEMAPEVGNYLAPAIGGDWALRYAFRAADLASNQLMSVEPS